MRNPKVRSGLRTLEPSRQTSTRATGATLAEAFGTEYARDKPR
jgi:hypothetical protein